MTAPAPASFIYAARIYWEDTDAGGIVYYANYLRFFERARTEWLRARGLGQRSLSEQQGGMFVVSRASVNYLHPARLDDRIAVTATLEQAGAASLLIGQQIWLQGPETGTANSSDKTGAPDPAAWPAAAPDRLLVTGQFRLAWVSAEGMRPERIPPLLLERLRG